MLIGAMWEIFETHMGKQKPELLKWMGLCDDQKYLSNDKGCWYGKLSDLLMNLLDFLTGRYINRGVVLFSGLYPFL